MHLARDTVGEAGECHPARGAPPGSHRGAGRQGGPGVVRAPASRPCACSLPENTAIHAVGSVVSAGPLPAHSCTFAAKKAPPGLGVLAPLLAFTAWNARTVYWAPVDDVIVEPNALPPAAGAGVPVTAAAGVVGVPDVLPQPALASSATPIMQKPATGLRANIANSHSSSERGRCYTPEQIVPPHAPESVFLSLAAAKAIARYWSIPRRRRQRQTNLARARRGEPECQKLTCRR